MQDCYVAQVATVKASMVVVVVVAQTWMAGATWLVGADPGPP